MNYVTLLAFICALSTTITAQKPSSYSAMFNGTTYDIAVKETSHVLSDVLYYIPIGGPINADTFNTINGYAPVDGGGFVSIACIVDKKLSQDELEAMRNANHGLDEVKDEVEVKIDQCRQKSGEAQTDCFCELADMYKARYVNSLNAIDLKRHQRALKACLEGE